jgi:hypothetical protein
VDFVIEVDVVFEVVSELICEAGLYESHGRRIDAGFALWPLSDTANAVALLESFLTWPPEKPTATMPKSLPFLRNLGWRVGASILGGCELLSEERRSPFLSSQYTGISADARSKSDVKGRV